MPTSWLNRVTAMTRERYPALLSYAAMLTPDLDEARDLTDAAITSVMGAFRSPRSAADRDAAVRDHIARGYLARHRTDVTFADAALSRFDDKGGASTGYEPSAFARPKPGDTQAGNDARPNLGIGLSQFNSPLAAALATVTAPERVAAVAWWVDGLDAEQVAERIDATLNAAIDALHHAGVLLSQATGDVPPTRDHFMGSGDVVAVEVSGGRR